MQGLFYFIERFHLIIIFFILEGIALSQIKKANLYHDSKMGNVSLAISSKINEKRSGIVHFFDLVEENKRLTEENALILAQLNQEEMLEVDTLLPEQSVKALFSYVPSQIIDNSVTQSVNYILINKGRADGVQRNQGVITAQGVVGIVTKTTENYAQVMSVLSTKSRISVKHAESETFGNMTWDGRNPWQIQIENVNKANLVEVGDTFTTTGYSSFFPPNIPTAIVEEVDKDPSSSFLNIKARLSLDIDRLSHVYVVHSEESGQIDSLTVSNLGK